jgi:hypothetical protein
MCVTSLIWNVDISVKCLAATRLVLIFHHSSTGLVASAITVFSSISGEIYSISSVKNAFTLIGVPLFP